MLVHICVDMNSLTRKCGVVSLLVSSHCRHVKILRLFHIPHCRAVTVTVSIHWGEEPNSWSSATMDAVESANHDQLVKEEAERKAKELINKSLCIIRYILFLPIYL